MNPQPDQFTINIFTIGFILLIIYYVVTKKNTTNIFANDLVDILYEVESKPINNIIIKQKKKKLNKSYKPYTTNVTNTKNNITHHTENVVEKIIPQPQIKEVLMQKTFNELHHECVNALMSLGMKKRESINTVIKIFNKYDITTIEDFIKKAFVPDEYYRSST